MSTHFRIIRRNSPELVQAYEEHLAAVIENICALRGMTQTTDRLLFADKFEKSKRSDFSLDNPSGMLQKIKDRIMVSRPDSLLNADFKTKKIVDLL